MLLDEQFHNHFLSVTLVGSSRKCYTFFYTIFMAKDKKSFILYSDLISTAEKMTRLQRGDLLWHILQYVNDLDPVTNDQIIELVFEPIKLQLKRDLKKYDGICKANSERGKLGGRPPKAKKSAGLIAKAKESAGLIKKAKKADTDTDTDTDNECLIDRDEGESNRAKNI